MRHMQIYDDFVLFGRQRYAVRLFFKVIRMNLFKSVVIQYFVCELPSQTTSTPSINLLKGRGLVALVLSKTLQHRCTFYLSSMLSKNKKFMSLILSFGVI